MNFLLLSLALLGQSLVVAEESVYPIGKCWCTSCFDGNCTRVDTCEGVVYKREAASEAVFPPIGHCGCTNCLFGCEYDLVKCPHYGEKRETVEEIVEKREAEVVEKREAAEEILLPSFGTCNCTGCFQGRCFPVPKCPWLYGGAFLNGSNDTEPYGNCSCTRCFLGRCREVDKCPHYGKKPESDDVESDGSIAKREAVEKREASASRCANIQECRCDDQGCYYVNGCLTRQVDKCPPLFGKKREAVGVVEKRDADVLAKRAPQICPSAQSCRCTPEEGCVWVWRCNAPKKVPRCPWPGKKREAVKEIVEKRESVEKRETDEGVNENGEVEVVEKHESKCSPTGKGQCECTNGHGCFYTNGCLRRKVPHCPWYGLKSETAEEAVEKSEVVEKGEGGVGECRTTCTCSPPFPLLDHRCTYCVHCKCHKVRHCPLFPTPDNSRLPMNP